MPAPLTDPVSVALGFLAAALALAAGYVQAPRPPALDGERWFKVALATVLRGRLEAAGADAWERAVIRSIPYHPAGRLPERKISNPAAADLPTKALPGEVALLEALRGRDTPEARVRYLYEEDVNGIEARTADPNELGAAYAFPRLRGGWDELAAWAQGDGALVAAARATVSASWVLFRGRPERRVGPPVLDALAALVPGAVAVAWGEDLFPPLERALPQPGSRVILVAEEAAVAELLAGLVKNPGLRDQVLAVVSIGGVIGGRTDEDGPYGTEKREDWMGAHFAQLKLDTEMQRLTPYFCVQWLGEGVWPPGVPGLPLQASRFPEPEASHAPVKTVEVVDLGPLWVERDLLAEDIARALFAVVTAWVASRR